jgi:hypothetical protein
MEKEDYQLGKNLFKLNRFTKEDVLQLENLLKKYVDKKTHICRKCNSQIKFALKRLQNFMNGLEFESQVVKEDVREEIVEQVVNSVEETIDEVTEEVKLEDMKSKQLRGICNELGLDTSREKQVMIDRIREYYEVKS